MQHEKHYIRVASQFANRLETYDLRTLEIIKKRSKLDGGKA